MNTSNWLRTLLTALRSGGRETASKKPCGTLSRRLLLPSRSFPCRWRDGRPRPAGSAGHPSLHLSLGRKLIDRCRPVDRFRPQNHRRKFWMVHRIRIVLCLQAKPGVFPVGNSSLAHQGAIEKIAGVKLHSRLCRPHLHLTSGERIIDSRGQFQFACLAAQYEVVIVSAGVSFHLRNSRADGHGMREVKGSSLHRLYFTRGINVGSTGV